MTTGHNLVDAHCHVDLLPNWQSVLNRLEEQAQFTFAVTTTPKAWSVEKEVVRQFRYVRVGVGLHPQVVHERKDEVFALEKAIQDTRFVGEVGLDGSPAHRSSLPDQERVLRRTFSVCAEVGDRVLSLHTLRATGAVLDLAEKTRVYERNTLIYHWFTGTMSELERALRMGALISVNADMLRTEKGRWCARIAGVSRTLTESDSPFTKSHRIESGLPSILPAVHALAQCWELSASSVSASVENIARAIWQS